MDELGSGINMENHTALGEMNEDSDGEKEREREKRKRRLILPDQARGTRAPVA